MICPSCSGKARSRDTTPLPPGDPVFGGTVLAIEELTGITLPAIQAQIMECPCGETRYLTALVPIRVTRKRYLRVRR